MNVTRRSFLTLTGAAALTISAARAYEIAAPVAPAPTPLAKPLALPVEPARQLTLHFLDSKMNAVGPTFEIPSEWWYVARNGVVRLRGQIAVHEWSGPPCVLMGIELRRGGEMLFRDCSIFNCPVCSWDSVFIDKLSIGPDAASDTLSIAAAIGIADSAAVEAP